MEIKMLNSLKKDGNMSFKYGIEDKVYKNRKKFFDRNNIKFENTVAIKVKYKDDIFILDDEFIKNNKDLSKVEVNTDCIITKQKDVFIYLPFADCIPLVIFDKKNNIMAFAHMGWQSIELKLHTKIVNYMIDSYNSNIRDLRVILGPSIKKQSYILKNPSQLKYNDWRPFLNCIGDDMYEIDLNGYIVNGLMEIGITDITNSKVNTAENNDYFSHFRSTYTNKREKEGRFICGAIMSE